MNANDPTLPDWPPANLEAMRESDRKWVAFTEAEQGALLLDLALALRRRWLHTQPECGLFWSYQAFAAAAQEAGQQLIRLERLPRAPEPPYRWEDLPAGAFEKKLPEIAEWAAWLIFCSTHPFQFLHAVLDLRGASRDLMRRLERRRLREESQTG